MTVILVMSFLILQFRSEFSVYLSANGQWHGFSRPLQINMVSWSPYDGHCSIRGAMGHASRGLTLLFVRWSMSARMFSVSCFLGSISASFWSFAILLILLGIELQAVTNIDRILLCNVATEDKNAIVGRVDGRLVLPQAMGSICIRRPN